MTWPVELTRPWLLPGLIVACWLVWQYRRSLVEFSRRQRRLSLAVRALIVLLLVLALSGLTVQYGTTRQYVLFVTDVSRSVDQGALDQAGSMLAPLPDRAGRHRIGFLTFSHRPNRLAGEVAAGDLRASSSSEGTDIGRAIRLARASIPPSFVPKIVLLSDGNETLGNAVQAAVAAEVPIHTLPLTTRREPEVQVSRIDAPTQVSQGARFSLEAVVDSNIAADGSIHVYVGSHKLQTLQHTLKKGENRVRFELDARFDRQAVIAVAVEGYRDTLLDNNEARAIVFSSHQPRVLLIASDRKSRANLVNALREHKIQVTDGSAEFFPDTLSELQEYDAIILSNVPANMLSVRKMQNVRTYVEELGGGFVMLGGDQSFGLGGYYKTPLEQILPVRSDFEREKEKPGLAMVLIIDKSNSMVGTKMEMAKDAARSAVELLGPKDQVGVIAFDGKSHWISKIHTAADKNYIAERISTIKSSGGTSMYPAMEDALQGLTSSVAKLKHVILLSDGHSSPGDFEGVTTQMAAARITVSTVAVGARADRQLLRKIAEIGNGRYYACDDPQSIPQIFAKETVTASKSAINEVPFAPKVVKPTRVLANLDLEAAPLLLGYVATRAKQTSEQILVTENGDPLLCWWRYGLGMSVAFTSDASSRWADEWLTAEDFYSNFWAQVVRHAMRKQQTRGVSLAMQRNGTSTTVTLDSIDRFGAFRNGLPSRLTLLRGDATGSATAAPREILMRQVAPGRYQSTISTAAAGTYHVHITQRDARGEILAQQTRGLVVGYPDELRLRPVNTDLLRRIADVSGGTYQVNLDTIFQSDGRRAARALPLWRYLLISALLLFVLDVALRRIEI